MSSHRSRFASGCRNKVVNDVLHRPYTLRALTGVMVEYCLGCGANGCAFRVHADGRSLVLKVSTHPGEAPIAEITKGLGRVWPFLPVFHGAWVVPGETLDRSEELGITLREDLIDFMPVDPDAYMDEATAFLEQAHDADKNDVLSLRRGLTPSLRRLAGIDALALRMIADFAVWSTHYELGFDLREFMGRLAVANLGQSLEDSAVVIRDLGNFWESEWSLKALRRATLQRARETSRRGSR